MVTERRRRIWRADRDQLHLMKPVQHRPFVGLSDKREGYGHRCWQLEKAKAMTRGARIAEEAFR